MALVLYHLNPATERIGRCRAENDKCPFGSENPHFTTKEETQSYYETKLEAEYGLFSDKASSLELNRSVVARRLNLLSAEDLNQLVWERWRRGGYTPHEANQMVAKGESFYVHFTANQEITLNYDAPTTQRTFMRGACAAFAAQVHQATGWPLAVYSSNEIPNFWQGHVAVKLPNGRLLDVSGVSDNPLREFGSPAKNWSFTEARSLKELYKQIANSSESKSADKKSLPLLERFAVAKIVYDVLDSEGLLKD